MTDGSWAPSVSKAAADGTRLVARLAAAWPERLELPLPGGGQMVIAVAGCAAEPPDPAWLAQLRMGRALYAVRGRAGAVLLGLDPVQTITWLSAWLDTGAPPAVARPLAPAEQGAVTAILASVLAHTGLAAVVVPESAAPVLLPTVCVHLSVTLHERLGTPALARMPVVVLTSGTALADEPPALPNARALSAAAIHASRMNRMVVSVMLVLGRTQLNRRDLAAAARGDVVVFDGQPRALEVQVGLEAAPAHLAENGDLRVVGGFAPVNAAAFATAAQKGTAADMDSDEQGRRRGDATSAEDSQTQPDVATARTLMDRLAAIPVEVVAELGRVSLRGDELAGLMAGSVLSLGAVARGPITLTVAGRPIALGEIVDVDGSLGVRLIERL